MIASAEKIQKTYGKFFDYILINGVLRETFEELKWILKNFETRPSFIPQEWINFV